MTNAIYSLGETIFYGLMTVAAFAALALILIGVL